MSIDGIVRSDLHAPGDFVDVSGERVFVRRIGDGAGPAAVLIHGLGGASGNWAELASLLSTQADIHVIDLPGYGLSPPTTTGRHDLATMRRVLVAYLELLGQPAHLLGNSMGGLLSVLVAGERPDLVRSLTLISPAMPHWWFPPAGRLVALLSLPGFGGWLLRMGQRVPLEKQVQRELHDLFGDPTIVPEHLVADLQSERARRLSQPYLVEVFVGSLRSLIAEILRPPRAWRSAASFDGETLVLLGMRDRLVHSSVGRVWERRVPRARVVRLPRVGHVAQMEQPELVHQFVLQAWGQA